MFFLFGSGILIQQEYISFVDVSFTLFDFFFNVAPATYPLFVLFV